VIQRSNTIPSKISTTFFKELEKILKLVWNGKTTLSNQSNLQLKVQNMRHYTICPQNILQRTVILKKHGVVMKTDTETWNRKRSLEITLTSAVS
jgi:hypothetical protein